MAYGILQSAITVVELYAQSQPNDDHLSLLVILRERVQSTTATLCCMSIYVNLRPVSTIVFGLGPSTRKHTNTRTPTHIKTIKLEVQTVTVKARHLKVRNFRILYPLSSLQV